jgi:hypothetical protein
MQAKLHFMHSLIMLHWRAPVPATATPTLGWRQLITGACWIQLGDQGLEEYILQLFQRKISYKMPLVIITNTVLK